MGSSCRSTPLQMEASTPIHRIIILVLNYSWTDAESLRRLPPPPFRWPGERNLPAAMDMHIIFIFNFFFLDGTWRKVIRMLHKVDEKIWTCTLIKDECMINFNFRFYLVLETHLGLATFEQYLNSKPFRR